MDELALARAMYKGRLHRRIHHGVLFTASHYLTYGKIAAMTCVAYMFSTEMPIRAAAGGRVGGIVKYTYHNEGMQPWHSLKVTKLTANIGTYKFPLEHINGTTGEPLAIYVYDHTMAELFNAFVDVLATIKDDPVVNRHVVDSLATNLRRRQIMRSRLHNQMVSWDGML